MTSRIPVSRSKTLRISVLFTALLGLTACAEGELPAFLQATGSSGNGEVVARGAGGASGGDVTTIERDVEAPEIFEAKEAGLWDGRPSLGGVWVAHPDVEEPERVLIRNETNGQFVIGALFKRERQSPGPRLQVSSDAAEAIGMLAGAPTNLHVVALRREDVAETPEPMAEPAASETVAAAPEVVEGTLDPIATGAAAALDKAMIDAATPAPAAVPAAKPAAREVAAATAPKPAPKPATQALAKPFIQIGIFSIEQNARNTATAMRQDGMVPTVKKHKSNGKTFWRVVVGPAQSKSELNTLLGKIRSTGFTDAYAVSG
ncbi:SPOR domain-containing protein [Cognatishimia sp. F0-27]|uniref:SPOR domain-containing protein n=1 Tax=Cognatishimia sp. F0-27 TaxID=2816855 RepID=UPI001D0CC6DE|nr:SPOR domain-containing protein [Cognatishimia sp. F0-27]MCC1494067.1 SPOR domain-containing protein [Cognatishimia sp. F0-27]